MDLMEKIVALAKRRGFIFQGSEIYGGLGGTWDYGPTGSLLKKNFKDLWWKEMVQLRDDVVGVDAAIMMNPRAWEASGHVEASQALGFIIMAASTPTTSSRSCTISFHHKSLKFFLSNDPVGP